MRTGPLCTLALLFPAISSATVVEDGTINRIDDVTNPSHGLAFFDMSYSDGLSLADSLAAAQAVHADARLATPAEWDALFAAAGVTYNGALTASDAFNTGSSDRIIDNGTPGAIDLASKLGATSGSSTYMFSGTDGSTDFASTRDYMLLSSSGWADIRQDSRVAPLSFVGWLIVTEAFMAPNDDECAGEGTGNNCDANAICTNTATSFTCDCDVGFSGDGVTCIDYNECVGQGLGNNCAAGAICTNLPGGFACDCAPGFTGDGTACIPSTVSQILTFSFEGTVVDIDDFTGAFSPTEFGLGSTVSGSYTFDALHPDNNGRPDGGYFQGAISDWQLSVGSWSGSATTGSIYNFDNWSTVTYDTYTADAVVFNGPEVSAGFEPSGVELEIQDLTGMGFSDDTLPYLTPSLAVFDTPADDGDMIVEFCENDTYFDCAYIAVDIDSLTSDAESDGVFDHLDNCPIDANPTQGDVDMDGFGDVCDIAPLLTITGSCPGAMTFDFTGFTPLGQVELASASGPGSQTIIPAAHPCTGVDSGLASNVRVRLSFQADAAGQYSTTRVFRRAAACGTLMRAIDLSTCALTPAPQSLLP